jgi:hypothetical protein
MSSDMDAPSGGPDGLQPRPDSVSFGVEPKTSTAIDIVLRLLRIRDLVDAVLADPSIAHAAPLGEDDDGTPIRRWVHLNGDAVKIVVASSEGGRWHHRIDHDTLLDSFCIHVHGGTTTAFDEDVTASYTTLSRIVSAALDCMTAWSRRDDAPENGETAPIPPDLVRDVTGGAAWRIVDETGPHHMLSVVSVDCATPWSPLSMQLFGIGHEPDLHLIDDGSHPLLVGLRGIGTRLICGVWDQAVSMESETWIHRRSTDAMTRMRQIAVHDGFAA